MPSDLQFLRSQLAIVCDKGFELMAIDREPLRTVSFPDWAQLKGDKRAMELQKRCNESKAVGMYRISEATFLFVFQDFAFYADKHGDPIQERYNDVIDFQGTAHSVVYEAPYLLIFDTNFVEIRHAATGKLVQIIKGQEIACTYQGQTAFGKNPNDAERRAHVTLRADNEPSYRIAELVARKPAV